MESGSKLILKKLNTKFLRKLIFIKRSLKAILNPEPNAASGYLREVKRLAYPHYEEAHSTRDPPRARSIDNWHRTAP